MKDRRIGIGGVPIVIAVSCAHIKIQNIIQVRNHDLLLIPGIQAIGAQITGVKHTARQVYRSILHIWHRLIINFQQGIIDCREIHGICRQNRNDQQ